MSITAGTFKNYKSDDHITLYVNGTKVHGYFKSVFADRINIEDMNFREHSYALSELSDPPIPDWGQAIKEFDTSIINPG